MSVIYQYQCKDSSITDTYIGSCNDYSNRKAVHKYCSSSNKATPFQKFVLEHGGWENWDCLILAKCEEGIDYHERLRLEESYIRQLKPTLNCKSAKISEKERKHRDKINNKKNYEENKEHYQNLKKQWYAKNREQNLDKAKKVIQCSCGKTYTQSNKSNHFKTKFHIKNSIIQSK